MVRLFSPNVGPLGLRFLSLSARLACQARRHHRSTATGIGLTGSEMHGDFLVAVPGGVTSASARILLEPEPAIVFRFLG